jgi:hypothetical protein
VILRALLASIASCMSFTMKSTSIPLASRQYERLAIASL